MSGSKMAPHLLLIHPEKWHHLGDAIMRRERDHFALIHVGRSAQQVVCLTSEGSLRVSSKLWHMARKPLRPLPLTTRERAVGGGTCT